VTWTYSGNPSASDLDKVRFLSGDTDSTNPIATNEEITFLLVEWDNDCYYAAASVCDYGANKAAAKADYSKSVGDLTLATQYKQQAEALHARSHAIRDQAAYHEGAPFVWAYPDALGNFMFKINMDKNYGS
jgi:hypothetical protein